VKEHRWSGWPGAWCLDCGQEDAGELCLADGHTQPCGRCRNGPCERAGEALYDPYKNPPDKEA